LNLSIKTGDRCASARTLHRGQIVGMLRQLGVKRSATDILFYYYEQAAPVAS